MPKLHKTINFKAASYAGVTCKGAEIVWGELHEEKTIELLLEETISSGKVNRLFKELGGTLHYDVYSLKLPKKRAGSLIRYCM